MWSKIEVALMCAMKPFNLWDQVDGFSDFKRSNNRYFVVSTYCMNKIYLSILTSIIWVKFYFSRVQNALKLMAKSI